MMFQLVDFRKLNTSIENVEVPARPENRTVTDKKGFVIFGIAILILVRKFRELDILIPDNYSKVAHFFVDTFPSVHLGQCGF